MAIFFDFYNCVKFNPSSPPWLSWRLRIPSKFPRPSYEIFSKFRAEDLFCCSSVFLATRLLEFARVFPSWRPVFLLLGFFFKRPDFRLEPSWIFSQTPLEFPVPEIWTWFYWFFSKIRWHAHFSTSLVLLNPENESDCELVKNQ